MADSRKEFVITELQRTANGRFQELPVRFVWGRETWSAPREGWQFGLQLRTVREDYPGADTPTEQVLGFNYKPFTVKGVWDDRYAGAGFAEATRAAFEALLARGNLVRIEFEELVIHGLITDFDVDYKRKWQQGYSFTVSPHFRQEGGDVRKVKLAPVAIANPNTYYVSAQALITASQALQTAAPRSYVAGDYYSQIASSVGDWQLKADTISSIVSNRVLETDPLTQSVNSIARLAGEFSSLADSAIAFPVVTAAGRTDLNLAYEDAIRVLEFETWQRQLNTYARALYLTAARAASELGARVTPDAMALYRPMAGESLYSISNRFYRTPHKWRAIASRNGLKTWILTGSELLIIPAKV